MRAQLDMAPPAGRPRASTQEDHNRLFRNAYENVRKLAAAKNNGRPELKR